MGFRRSCIETIFFGPTAGYSETVKPGAPSRVVKQHNSTHARAEVGPGETSEGDPEE